MFILQSAFLGIIFANTEEKSSQTKNKPKTACSIPKCLFGVIFLHMEQTTEVAFSDSRPHLGKSFRPHMWIIIKAPKTLSSITWRVTFHQFYGIADWTDYRGKRGLDGLGFGIRPTATLNTTVYPAQWLRPNLDDHWSFWLLESIPKR